jgi:hypothetical protein
MASGHITTVARWKKQENMKQGGWYLDLLLLGVVAADSGRRHVAGDLIKRGCSVTLLHYSPHLLGTAVALMEMPWR